MGELEAIVCDPSPIIRFETDRVLYDWCLRFQLISVKRGLLCFRYDGFKRIGVLHHRAIEENGLRQIVAPARSRRIRCR